MAIVFSSQADLSGSGNILGDLTDSIGIPGFPDADTRRSGLTSNLESIRNKMNDVIGKLTGKKESFDRSYVGSGKKEIVGSGLEGGLASPIEEASIRQVYSQTPQLSVIIRKKAFSSLSHLYNGSLMDDAEKWLLRATKRLVERKCSIMAEYERLVKAERMIAAGESTASIISSLISSSIDETNETLDLRGNKDTKQAEFTSARELEKIIMARQPVSISTFFKDPESAGLSTLGEGSGAFEITSISDLNTSLDVDGNGSCSFTIEDPYKILFVNEEDIEVSLRETAPSNLQAVRKGQQVTVLLESAQIADESLSKNRILRGASEITFSVSMSGSSGVSAVIDALGFELTTSNLDDVPEGYELTSYEQTLFRTVMAGLNAYDQLIRLNILQGVNAANNSKEMSDNMTHVRKRMRLFYLGKSIIQPMDSINVFIAGGTRKSGEGEDIPENGTLDSAIKTVASVLSHYGDDGSLGQGPDEKFLEEEWKRFKGVLTFEDFKKVRTMQLSTESGTHVFGGLVRSVNDRFEANSGKYTLSVQGDSNMEWLKISRYNSQPSLDQTQGLVYDPFTPFTYDVNGATGLPIGEPKWLPENKRRVESNCRKTFHETGPKRGSQVNSLDNDVVVSAQRLGANLKKMFQHVPGLTYRWKEGIMTAIYDMSTTNPLNGKRVDYKQLRRDVGLFTSNTPFDNMDAANIISVMVTGKPYNINTFIQSASGSGAYIKDDSLNNQKSYFSSLLDIQGSFIQTHGDFSPYKFFSVDYNDLALAMALQQRLTGKSSEMQQLQAQYAQLTDKVANFSGKPNAGMTKLLDSLESKRSAIFSRLETLETKFSELTAKGAALKDNVIQIAGNDISFDLADSKSIEDCRRFGDKLFFSTLRKREDVIYNRDSNFLIISDEYDKDYDIQAFVLKLRQQVADMWTSTWQSVYELCRTVAETLNFEFHCNTQGHLVFRPPQYNRTPISVLAAMLSYSKDAGITVFPEFLLKLFHSREESLINDINAIEWRIVKSAALLGKTSIPDIEQLIGKKLIFVDNEFKSRGAIAADAPYDSAEKKKIKESVSQGNRDVQIANNGVFSTSKQFNLFKELVGPGGSAGVTTSEVKLGVYRQSAEKVYENAVKNLAKLTGRPAANFEEFDKVMVGALRNGKTTPATDIANLLSQIAGFISQRSKLLRTLEKVLDQNVEMSEVNGNTTVLKSSNYLNVIDLFKKKDGVYSQLIEDDTRNIIGPLSGERFVIRDEHIISSSFTEQPPEMTVAAVHGTEPIVGEGQGKVAGMPLYLAYGVDFDMWRQYGWRAEKPFEKPFFWSADQQCAPYAVMLLSRQRKNIITGTVTVIGNEFYQLGDVVYVADRQLLYYVTKVTHSFSYNGDFKTTLDLKYGHAPGEYIPTPLDVIGKLSTSRAKTQNAFRMRREKSLVNNFLGVVRFQDIELEDFEVAQVSDKNIMINGKFGYNNYRTLLNAAIKAKREMAEDDISNSSRIYILTYAGSETTQEERRKAVADWFINPQEPAASGSNIGMLSATTAQKTNEKRASDYKIDPKFIKNEHIRMCLPSGEKLTETENTLIKELNMVASQEAITFDDTLESVVEIRLRKAPPGGWKKDTK